MSRGLREPVAILAQVKASPDYRSLEQQDPLIMAKSRIVLRRMEHHRTLRSGILLAKVSDRCRDAILVFGI
jgi:hypothetical protein